MNTKLPIFQLGASGKMHFSRKTQSLPFTSLALYLLLIFFLFLTLSIRLFQLTVVKGTYYGNLAENNRIREVLIEPKRGNIVDRKGFILVQNQAVDIQKQLSNKDIVNRITSKRTYLTPLAIAPIVGYRQVADPADFENDPCLNKLHLGDKVGKKGVEWLYDCQLRGQYGKRLVEVNANGTFLRTITVDPPKDGQTIQLALDWDLQQKAYELIKNKRAAVVALKPSTGEILALVSTPTFNPQDFEDNRTDLTRTYLTDKDHPLFNRVTEGTYPPGSVFKLVVAAGALEEHKISETTMVNDTGTIKAGTQSFGNWYYLEYGKTEGELNITQALKRSNDIFFYLTGAKLGPDDIKHWAEAFGYGKKSGLGLSESEGLIPSPFWKEEQLNEQWYLGDTYNLSIGQGYVLTTPLQVAQATATIANNGTRCSPQLLKNPKTHCSSLHMSKTTLNIIHEGMKEACSPGGTGWPLFNFSVKDPFTPTLATNPTATSSGHVVNRRSISVSCKTGTAESYTPASVPHAWFTAYAPSGKPEIVLTVLVEEAGQGSDIGGPIAKELLTSYFERSQ